MTVNDLKALIHGDTNIPPASQHCYYDNRAIRDGTQTLEQLNIRGGDMIGVAVHDPSEIVRRRTQQESSSQASSRPTTLSNDDFDPERFRLHIMGDPRLLEQVRQQNPELANAAHDPEQYYAIWEQQQDRQAQLQAEKAAKIAMLNADPFNSEAQAEIAEIIRQERVSENVQQALDENPESFARVIMLYIEVVVNNTPIKAFVDSGASSTIMSPDAAQACGIMRLIDRRWNGIARGVGTAEILGRVHSAEIQIGSYSLQSSFTVMEGKEVDLLLGLDMLKRHQMCIDLNENVLRVQDEKIPFLPEHEVPKQHEEHMFKDEPTIEGPGGMTIGGITGKVEQHGKPTPGDSGPNQTQEQAGKQAEKQTEKQTETQAERERLQTTKSVASSSHTRPAPSSSSNPAPTTDPPPPRRSTRFSQESIAQITDFGFTTEQAIHALSQVGGNVELALSLLL